MRRSAMLTAGVVVAVGLSITACGGGGGTASGTVDADTWAGAVCGALGTWVKDIQASGTSFQAEVTGTTDPVAAKEQLSGLADDVLATTDTMLTGVKAAGVPDVDKGAELEAALNTGLASVKPIFQSLKTGVAALPTDSPETFVAGAGVLQATITTGLDAFGESLGNIESPALDKAFEANAACQSLGS